MEGGEEARRDGGEILHWAGPDDAEGGDDEHRDAEEGERVEAQVVDHLHGAASEVHVHPRARRPEAAPPPPPPCRHEPRGRRAAPARAQGAADRHTAPGGGGGRRGEEGVVPRQRHRRRGSRHGAKAGGARACNRRATRRRAARRGTRTRREGRGAGRAVSRRVHGRLARARGFLSGWGGRRGGVLGEIRCRGGRCAARALVRLSLSAALPPTSPSPPQTHPRHQFVSCLLLASTTSAVLLLTFQNFKMQDVLILL